MSLLGRLTEKSWETPGVAGFAEPGDGRPAAITVMIAVYCAVAAMIFSLIVMAYLMRMGIHSAIGHGSGDWKRMPEPALLWVNTGVLLLASVAWEWARRAAVVPGSQNGAETMRRGMLAGGLLGIAFLGGQLLLWRDFHAAGYYLAANPANAFFYLLTAIHGLHLIGGIVGWLGVLNHPTSPAVRLCALYWHFLLLIWVLLAGLLFLT